MNPAELAEVLAKLGIAGVDPTRLSAAMTLVEALGGQVAVDPEAVKSYYPDIDEESFYLPHNLPDNFYYDAKGLRKLNEPGNMRGLTSVNSNVFRRLLGIE